MGKFSSYKIKVSLVRHYQKIKKNLFAIAGIISGVLGITIAIPSFLKEQILLAVLSSLLIIAGLVLLAFAFGD